ncbi:RNA-directed DNA polymerase, eukaryota, reverse transcriptase zinc-binding domain protein, partial [Tanacetum coccineum]
MNGRILGDINATIISLIPKIPVPNKVSDFRPIPCCNVLYKCISKVLTNRIQKCLGKLISANQSAFIKGRQIQDNILLTQELLKGYERKGGPKRVAFKVDIQKAYDTVNWSFLEQILIQFGFHYKMVKWVMACVSTAKFSINVNGESHGFFKGGRGLRQGDPLSPYLFTIVMEVFSLMMQRNIRKEKNFHYHFGCKQLKITHVCFADDLIVFCHGDTTSVKVIKKTMEEFSKCSGLIPNKQKSTILFGSMPLDDQQIFLDIVPFVKGNLPMRYLGVPLITKRLGIKDCKPLIDKIK